MFLSEWREFPSAHCLVERKILMTARVSMFLKSRVPFLVGLRTYQHPDTAAIKVLQNSIRELTEGPIIMRIKNSHNCADLEIICGMTSRTLSH